jgi:hypothetical protein
MKLLNSEGVQRITFVKSSDMSADTFSIVFSRIVSLSNSTYTFNGLQDENGFLICNQFVAFNIDPSAEEMPVGEYVCSLYCNDVLVASMLVRVVDEIYEPNGGEDIYNNVIIL